jgi:hypothetical protein
MTAVDWALVASLIANAIMLWQLWQQKHEFEATRRTELMNIVKASMKTLYGLGLELRAFAHSQKIDPSSERGAAVKRALTNGEATYAELESLLAHLASHIRIRTAEFNGLWTLVHTAGAQIDELGKLMEVAKGVAETHNNRLQRTGEE